MPNKLSHYIKHASVLSDNAELADNNKRKTTQIILITARSFLFKGKSYIYLKIYFIFSHKGLPNLDLMTEVGNIIM
jgi:hypothetical protein